MTSVNRFDNGQCQNGAKKVLFYSRKKIRNYPAFFTTKKNYLPLFNVQQKQTYLRGQKLRLFYLGFFFIKERKQTKFDK